MLDFADLGLDAGFIGWELVLEYDGRTAPGDQEFRDVPLLGSRWKESLLDLDLWVLRGWMLA